MKFSLGTKATVGIALLFAVLYVVIGSIISLMLMVLFFVLALSDGFIDLREYEFDELCNETDEEKYKEKYKAYWGKYSC